MAELSELQTLIERTRKDRGFTTEPLKIFTLLSEEVGEVAAELKKTWSSNYGDMVVDDLANELADVFVLLNALASSFNVDLETAVNRKFIEADSKRNWTSVIADNRSEEQG